MARARPPWLTAAAPKSAAPVAAAVAPSAAAAAPVAAAQAQRTNFGRERQVAAEEQKRQQDEARSLGELRRTSPGIETRMDGLMTFTLDNGQVWRQNSSDSKFHLEGSGDRVKIQPGTMKFILSGPPKITRSRESSKWRSCISAADESGSSDAPSARAIRSPS